MTGLVKRLEAMNPPLVRRRRNETMAVRLMSSLTDARASARFMAVQRGLMDQLRAVFGLLPESQRRDIINQVRLYFTVFLTALPRWQQRQSCLTRP